MKAKPNQAARGKLVTAVEALKKDMAVAAVKRHRTLESAAHELGLTVAGMRNILKRHGYRFKVQSITTLEFQGRN